MRGLSNFIADKAFLLKSATSFVIRIAGQILSLVVVMALTRLLALEDYGTYAVLMSLAMILSIVVKEGAPNLWTRYSASYLAVSNYPHYKGMCLTAFFYTLLMSLFVVMLAWLFQAQILHFYPAIDAAHFLYVLWFVPFLGGIYALHGLMKGLHLVLWAQIPEFIVRPILFIIMMLVVAVWVNDAAQLTLNQAFVVHLCAMAIALILSLWLFIRRLPSQMRQVKADYALMQWGKVLLPLMAASGLILINQNADIIMLGAMDGPEAAGLYQVATRTANLLLIILFAVNAVIGPMIAKLHAEDKRAEMQALLHKAGVLLTGITLPLVATASAFVLLSWAQAINALAGPIGLVAVMTGNQIGGMISIALSSVLNIGLNYMLIPLYGLEGAAIATGASLLTWNALLTYFVWRNLGVNCTILPFWGVKEK